MVRAAGKSPCIILFTKEQIFDLKRFCCSGPATTSTVLGVDKTFNLADLHATITVFKNLSLETKHTKEHPIFLGPILLHGNSDFSTFFAFFHHLAGELKTVGAYQQPIVGSDDEKSMRLAILKAFSESKRVNCTRHLKNNLKRYLQDKVGLNSQKRKIIVNQFFGTDGAVHADDEITCRYRIKKAKESILSINNKELLSYSLKLETMQEENFKAAFQSSNFSITMNWTNNNCESMNHVLKQKIDWKKCDLPTLVVKLHEVVQAQYNKVKRSLVGFGVFVLTTEFQKFFIVPEKWIKKSASKRQQLLNKFLTTPAMLNLLLTSSTNGAKHAITPKHGGRKPCQKKGHRTAKTTSYSKTSQC